MVLDICMCVCVCVCVCVYIYMYVYIYIWEFQLFNKTNLGQWELATSLEGISFPYHWFYQQLICLTFCHPSYITQSFKSKIEANFLH